MQRAFVLAAGGIRIAQKFDEPAKRQCGQLPPGATLVHPRPDDRPESKRKDLGMNARPAPDDVVTEFMDRHDDQERDHEGRDGVKKTAERRDQSDCIQWSGLCSERLDCLGGAYPRHMVGLGDVIKGDRGINEAGLG